MKKYPSIDAGNIIVIVKDATKKIKDNTTRFIIYFVLGCKASFDLRVRKKLSHAKTTAIEAIDGIISDTISVIFRPMYYLMSYYKIFTLRQSMLI